MSDYHNHHHKVLLLTLRDLDSGESSNVAPAERQSSWYLGGVDVKRPVS